MYILIQNQYFTFEVYSLNYLTDFNIFTKNSKIIKFECKDLEFDKSLTEKLLNIVLNE